jgi:hypothetical protein
MNDRVVQVICESVVVRRVDRVVDNSIRAGRAARIPRRILAATRAFIPSAPALRRGQGGVALLTAVVVHLLLRLASAADPGWAWLILPGAILVVAVLLIGTGFSRRRDGRSAR